MTEDRLVLDELVKAKENIKRKYNELKRGEDEVHSLMSQTFKPIIEPLKKISDNHYQPNLIKQDNTQNYENKINPLYGLCIDNWFQSYDLDRTYGPKKSTNGKISLGEKYIKFTEDTLFIDDSTYTLTPGLLGLVFLKNPTYTPKDLEVYKSILVQTSAHLSLDKKKIKTNTGNKYTNIISNIFKSGEGYNKVILQKHNLVYWNDPNELVCRLQTLLASQEAGNTGVSNEILSIYEELYEAGIIKRIPNV